MLKKLLFIIVIIVAVLVFGFLIFPPAFCKLTGGTFNRWIVEEAGKPLLQQMCIRRYQDAGKKCTDSSQCGQGKCLYEDPDNPSYREWARAYKPGQTLKVQGKCEKDDNPFKCTAEVKQGVIDFPIACLEPAH